jgi:hypothetical protein
MYEGRTRGKKMRYTYSEDEDEDDYSLSDAPRRSARTSGLDSFSGPTVTASGRQVKTRFGNVAAYGASGNNSEARGSPATDNYQRSEASDENDPQGRTRAPGSAPNGWVNGRDHIEGYNAVDELDDEDEAMSSGEEWQGEDEMDDRMEEEDDASSEDMSEDELDGIKKSLVVKLQYRQKPNSAPGPPANANANANGETSTAAPGLAPISSFMFNPLEEKKLPPTTQSKPAALSALLNPQPSSPVKQEQPVPPKPATPSLVQTTLPFSPGPAPSAHSKPAEVPPTSAFPTPPTTALSNPNSTPTVSPAGI